MGVILTDFACQELLFKPLENYSIFHGDTFGIEWFRLMITYADTDRKVVSFLRKLGVTLQQIATDPALNLLWQQYGREVIEDSAKIAAAAGIVVPTDKTYDINVEDPATSGVSEIVLLAVRNDEIAWFAQNPAETEYIRRVVPGEFPSEVDATWVKVIKADNARLRIPLKRVNNEFVECSAPPG
jgi:hypothetical protein